MTRTVAERFGTYIRCQLGSDRHVIKAEEKDTLFHLPSTFSFGTAEEIIIDHGFTNFHR